MKTTATRITRFAKPRSASPVRSAFLAAALALAAAAPFSTAPLHAQNKSVNTSGTTYDANNTYYSISNQAALTVHSHGLATPAVYSGTNLTLINTATSGRGIWAFDIRNGGVAYVYSSTILSPSGTSGSLGTVESSGTLYLHNVTAESNYGGIAALGAGSTLIVHDSTVTIASNHALNSYNSGNIEVHNSVLTAGAEAAPVIGMYSGGRLTLDRAQLIATGTGGNTYGVYASGADLVFTDSRIQADTGIRADSGTTGSIHLENTAIDATHTGIELINTATLTITGGLIQSGSDALRTSSTSRHNVNISGGAVLEGRITNSGTGALVVTLDHSSLTGGIHGSNDGATTVTLDNHSQLTGDILGGDNAALVVTLGNSSTMAGDITTTGTGAVTLNMARHTRYDGDITHGGGALNLNLTVDSHGRGHWQHGSLSLDPTSSWTFTGSGNIIDELHNDGTLNLAVDTDTGAGTSLAITGTASGTGTVHIDTTGNGTKDPNDVIPPLVTINGTDIQDWTWDYVDWGLGTAIRDEDGTWRLDTRSSTLGAVLNSAVVLQQAMWFAQNDSLSKRLGDLRLAPPAATLSLWTRAHAQQLNLGGEVAGRRLTQTLYGIDLGADRAWKLAGATLHTGLYAGYGKSTADYDTPGAEADLTSTHGGLYATYLRDTGLYIDAVLKIAGMENTLRLPTAASLEAAYDNLNAGLTVEIGKKFPLDHPRLGADWFIEPILQLACLHIDAKDHTAGPLHIAASDMDALQARLTHTIGKTIRLARLGTLQPYARLGGSVLTSSGGEIRNGPRSLRPAIDGARLELGGGVVWQLGAAHQLHADYEASYSEDYTKPWGLTLGYRWQF